MEVAVSDGNKNVTDPAYKVVRGLCTHAQLAVSDPRRARIMMRGHDKASTSEHPFSRSVKQDITEGIASTRFNASCTEAGLIHIMGAGYFTSLSILDQQLSVAEAIELCTKVFTLTLCGFGLVEEEAHRIVSDSARNIMTG